MGWSYTNSAGDEIIRDGEAVDNQRDYEEEAYNQRLLDTGGDLDITYDNRLQDRLLDDEGNLDDRHYEVYGVWGDGVPVVIEANLTYVEACAVHKLYMAARGTRVPPVFGITDTDDPERGHGPWED